MDYMQDLKAYEMLTNTDAEYSVLGTFIVDENTQKYIDEIPVRYFTGTNKSIIKAFKNAFKENNFVTFPVLVEEVKKLNSSMDISTLSNLTSYRVRAGLLKRNIDILKELSDKRYMFEIVQDASESILNGEDIDDISFTLTNKMDSLEMKTDVFNDDIESITLYALDILQDTENAPIQFGFTLLDNNIGGIFPGGYTVIGAKSGAGKTTFAINIAFNILKQDKKVLFVTCEMPAHEISNRFISHITGISTTAINKKVLKDEEYRQYINAMALLNSYNLYINDKIPRLSQITKRIQQLQPDVVIIDYLQILQSDSLTKGETAEQRISNISREIRNISIRYNVHIIALVQLNQNYKGVPHGENIIRQSSVVYQDATSVIYLHKPIEFEEMKYTFSSKVLDDERIQGLVNANKTPGGIKTYTLNLDKNRQGAPGVTAIGFIPDKLRFLDKDKQTEIDKSDIKKDKRKKLSQARQKML